MVHILGSRPISATASPLTVGRDLLFRGCELVRDDGGVMLVESISREVIVLRLTPRVIRAFPWNQCRLELRLIIDPAAADLMWGRA